jgi:hypothetical protein
MGRWQKERERERERERNNAMGDKQLLNEQRTQNRYIMPKPTLCGKRLHFSERDIVIFPSNPFISDSSRILLHEIKISAKTGS